MAEKESVYLLVDDKLENLISLKALINESFPRAVILTAQNGHEGLMLAKMKEPDIILLDIMMPDMDGFEVCQTLKADEVLKDIPVVFVTALKSDRQTRTRALESGAEAFLNKPIDEIELFAQLSAMLKIRELNIKKRETIKELESDLTSIKQIMIESEDQIKENLHKFMFLAERINDAMFFFDLNGKIIEANPAAHKLYGYSFDEFKAMKIMDLMREKSTEPILQQIKTAAKDEIIFETIHYKKDNSSIHVEVSSKGTVIGDKKILLSIVRDITERKKAEDILRESEAKFKAAFMTGPDAFYWATLQDGKIIEVNDRFESVFGYSRDEVIGKTSLELGLYSEYSDRARMVAELQEKGFARELELQGRRKNGALITVAISVSKIELSGQMFILGVIRDISERKMIEVRLQQSMDDLLESQRIAHLGTWRLDLKTNQVVWSEELYKIYGFDPTIPPPLYTESMKLFTPESWDRLSTALEQTSTSGIPYELELETVYSDGSNGWMWVRGEAEKDSRGNIIALWGAAQDVSERKNTEKALLESEKQYRNIFNIGADSLFLIDQETGAIIEANTSACNTYGYSYDELLRLRNVDVSAEQEQTRNATQALKQEHITIALRYHKKKDGTVFPVEIRASLFELNRRKVILIASHDITERKRAEEAIRTSNLNLLTILNSSLFGVTTISKNKEIRWANPAAIRMMGVNSLEDIVGKKCFEYFCPVHEGKCPIFNEGQIVDNSERSLKRFNGEAIPIIKSVTPITIDGEELLLETFIDISERKQMETSLRESEELFRGIINSMNDVVYTLDTKQRHTGVFGNWVEKSNLTKEFFLGKTAADLYGPEYGKMHEGPSERALSGEHVTYEWEINNGGGKKYYQTSLSPMYDPSGSVSGVVGIGRDITNIKQSIEQLNDSEMRFRSTFEQAAVGFAHVDLNGTWLIVNKKLCDIVGYTRDELLQRTFQDITYPDDLENDLKFVNMMLNGQNKTYNIEKRYIRKDGSIIWANLTVTLIRKPSGDPNYFISVVEDITARKKMEEINREHETRFHSFIEQSPVAIGIFSLEGLGLYANQKYIETLGLNNIEEFIGRPAYTYFAPQFIEESKERTRRRLQGLPVPAEYESIAVHIDGSEFPVHLAIAPIHLPSGIVSIAFLTDITDRKKAEMAIRLEAERYNALIESTKDWIWVADPENYGLTIFNTAVADYFKKNHDIILKNGMIPEEMLSENRIDLWRGLYDKATREGRFTIDYQTNVENLHLKVSLSPLIVEGKAAGVSVFAKDITAEDLYKEELEISNQALSTRLYQSINAISKIGELRDVYTAGHQKRVAELACAIALELGLPDETVKNISFGALIHDIGKIYIASDILNKPGKISNLEYQIMQTHAEQSYEVVKEIDFPAQIKSMIYQHHERMDGSGYPQKLVGDEITLESRILAVADVVEAMNSHRPYRPALGIGAALDEIQFHKGTKYDADVVDACIKLFRDKGFQFTV